MLYERALAESKQLDAKIQNIQSLLTELPHGEFFCTHQGKYSKWYYNNGAETKYLSKKERPLAEQLAKKKYLSYLLEDMKHEKMALDFYLRHHVTGKKSADSLLAEDSVYQELLSPFFQPKSQELTDWMNAPYASNAPYPEQLLHSTLTSVKVRSKSEAMIASFLQQNNIPFRYECPLALGNTILHPDFTIRHPLTGDFYYWEHFGMMDDPNYCKNCISKLQLYVSHQIIPSIQLITTYETKEHPLFIGVIQENIKHYFL